MCGIVCYVGHRKPLPLLIEGLKRLEYRGYDSAGLALHDGEGLQIHKKSGKIRELESTLPPGFGGNMGIAHTRWATHGPPTDLNAHPHTSRGRIAIVHNGIIENRDALQRMLEHSGYSFTSETDSEVLAHLIDKFYADSLEGAVQSALRHVKGSYGVAVLSRDDPDRIVVARNGSPVVLGVGDGEMFAASDVTAMVGYTHQAVFLDDGEIASITPDGFQTATLDNELRDKAVESIEFELDAIEKGDHAHYMSKEIHEQPESVRRTLRGRLQPEYGTARLGGLNIERREFFDFKRAQILGCGTSYHAAMAASYLLNRLARLPTHAEIASEYRYRNPVVEKETLYFVISQSGETADSLAALREIQLRGGKVLGCVNAVGSTIARETDGGVYVRCGPEIAVASTKAFTSQVATMSLMALLLGRMRDMGLEAGRRYSDALDALPDQIAEAIACEAAVRDLAHSVADANYVLFLGRGISFPVALEGALKLKEISYLRAEGYAAAEMKHGPIALISEGTPVIVVAPDDELHDKTLSNIEEVRARGGRVIAIGNPGCEQLKRRADRVVVVPKTLPGLSPILTVIPLQLLAYHAAVVLGRDVDQPRNLAKSVTVE
jgi:glucosamine--fructose-6-phosphate aminotransferase (isomerizing)